MNQGVNGNRLSRDAIIVSGWTWNAFNTPERVALALTLLGARVLYCENPRSFFRSKEEPLREVLPGIYRLLPQFLGHRLNHVPYGAAPQAKMIARQILENASKLQLKSPLFIYPHGDFFVPLSREFKRRGFSLVHECFDYPEPGQERHIELSDVTLTLSRTIFHQLKAKYGMKIAMIPEVRWLELTTTQEPASAPPPDLSAIPRPRLGYIGAASNRLNLQALEGVLKARPDWHFIHFGQPKCLPLPNVHVIGWRDPTKLGNVISHLDVGLMPYDCHSNKNFHCMPLKVFDYFLAGIPVVSTPIVNLWEYSDLIYFGDDSCELIRAIEIALKEPADSPRKTKRIEIGKRNSIEALARALATALPSDGENSNAPRN